jgi:hypothetical protein
LSYHATYLREQLPTAEVTEDLLIVEWDPNDNGARRVFEAHVDVWTGTETITWWMQAYRHDATGWRVERRLDVDGVLVTALPDILLKDSAALAATINDSVDELLAIRLPRGPRH